MATPGCEVVAFDEVRDQDAVEIEAMLGLEVTALRTSSDVKNCTTQGAFCKFMPLCSQQDQKRSSPDQYRTTFAFGDLGGAFI